MNGCIDDSDAFIIFAALLYVYNVMRTGHYAWLPERSAVNYHWIHGCTERYIYALQLCEAYVCFIFKCGMYMSTNHSVAL